MSVSPSKGKANWHAGWWDFYPLIDSPRPLQWSQSSIIFTAHPSQPLVTARHFSSSKQFAIPSPKPVTSTPSTYDPPTVISVAPGDEWLFAYFPKNTGEGTGCLWKRGLQIDNWIVQEWWSFPHQTAPVAANWLTAPREWTINKNTGLPERLPPHGPVLPTSSPTLILVTQDYRVHVCYYQYYIQNLQIIKCPLGATVMLGPGPGMSSQVIDDEPAELVKLCTGATIGTSYNPNFQLLIAAKLRQFTISATQTTPFDPMDLTVPVHSQNNDQQQDDWDSRNDDYIIAITQVYLRYDGTAMAVYINPLTPISIPNANIFRMDFLSCPVPTPPPEVTSSPKKPIADRGKVYLAISYLDFEGYVSAPKSQITLYSLTRRQTPSGKLIITHQLEMTRIFSSGVLTYVASTAPHLKDGLLPVIILDTSGQVDNTPSKKPSDIVAGKIHMLSLPTLEDRVDWEPTDIKISFSSAGKDLPLQAVPSPNGLLFYTTSLLSPQPCTSIQFAPVTSHAGVPPLTYPLILAILNKRSPSDICHYLSSPTISLENVINTLKSTMTILDANSNGLKYASTWDILGIAVEVYRKRLQYTKDEELRQQLTDKWQTAHDICSVAACNIVFGDCAAGNTYDLDAVWQLTGLANWVIAVTEKIMRECVTFWDIPEKAKVQEESQEDLFGPMPDENGGLQFEMASALLHLVHPFALQNLVTALKHVKKYRQYIGSLPPRTTNAQISKEYLVDLVDYSGINLGEVEVVLEASLQDVIALQPEDCRASLAACQPTSTLQPQLNSIIKKIANSTTALNKATLFIKTNELIDGVSNLNLGTQKKYQVEDVVTRGIVMTQEPHLMCSRCGGSSRIVFDIRSPQVASDRWRIWEKMWSLRCVCGGSWLNKD